MNDFERKRLAAGLTQTAIAEKLRVAPATVSRWATGDSTPAPKYFPKLAKLLSMTADEVVMLFHDSEAASSVTK